MHVHNVFDKIIKYCFDVILGGKEITTIMLCFDF